MSDMTLPERVAVVGLGYVGLHLAVAFSKHFPTVGFDVDPQRVEELKQGNDRNCEVPPEALKSSRLHFTTKPAALGEADFIAIAVPTPVDKAKRPDLSALKEASSLVGKHLRRGAVVVYESTVYPGCTEEVCIPILEQASGLKAGADFKVGYSPERINPGDPEHTLEKVVKVVAGQDAETTEFLARVYGLVVKAGVYKAPDIRTAEAAKVIENIQRDINIALMNELAMLFHRLGIDTHEVLKAARTKWNFLPFEPGLVGGHCIPVDPYYLTYKAQEVGFHPEIILAGRRVNDSMGRYVAQETMKLLAQAGQVISTARILVLGATFKEDVPDMRNSQVVDLIQELKEYGAEVLVYDPLIPGEELQRFGLTPVRDPFDVPISGYDAVILVVPHKELREKPFESYQRLFRSKSKVFVDVKGVFREEVSDSIGIYWCL